MGAHRDAREHPTCPTYVDDVDDSEADYDKDGEFVAPAMGGILSNRQKKKEAKMKFSGSRPKGRHRS